MPARVIMVQGTASHVGKTVVTAGLCRLFAAAGVRVAPFKAQNMALNSFVTADGGEIGRSQAVEAWAAMVEPHVDMNPVLLKPKGRGVSQLVLLGRPVGDVRAHEGPGSEREALWHEARAALERLRRRFDLVVAEGAGSPAELNLRQGDIANMRVAVAVGAPVLLVGDIERGGVFAQLLGTLGLLPAAERALVAGLVVNKFRGDPELFAEGRRLLEERGGVPVLGVLPWLPLDLDEEDTLSPPPPTEAPDVDVAVIRHPHISNFTDLDPLRRTPGVAVRLVDRAAAFGTPDAVILPGTKNTVADLAHLWRSGLAPRIQAAADRGAFVLGLCGGLQMLGERVEDPEGLEDGTPGSMPGLGLLPLVTRFRPGKATHQVEGYVPAGLLGPAPIPVSGYEIHSGESERAEGLSPLVLLERRAAPSGPRADGAYLSPRLMGTYVHGLLESRDFRRAWLDHIRAAKGLRQLTEAEAAAGERPAAVFDELAAALRRHLDLGRLARLAGVDL